MEGFMRILKPLAVIPFLALFAAPTQGRSPAIRFPAPIEKKGLAVEVKDLVRLPDTRGSHGEDDVSPAGWARISYVKDSPDGRRFANDSRGFLYLLDANNQPHVYADITKAFPNSIYQPAGEWPDRLCLPSRLRPQRSVLHGAQRERPGNPKTPDFIPPGYG
jgi:hypothetical protein